MSEYYYQIKGKAGESNYSMSNWSFPPIFSGKVTAENRKDAKDAICDIYGKQFPLRVLRKDIDSNEFLLWMKEIGEDDHHVKRLFEVRKCKHCDSNFRIIDKYNDTNCEDKSPDCCSNECKREIRQIEVYKYNETQLLTGQKQPVIYKIKNKNTGRCYIGQTTQVFTLRWYQHFFHGGDTKFHRAIKESKLTDWTFEIIEMVELPEATKTSGEIKSHIDSRENFHIVENLSAVYGYNTIGPTRHKKDSS